MAQGGSSEFGSVFEKGNFDRRIGYLREVFTNDLAGRWSVAKMAQTVNLSVSHLNRLFKTELGVSPKQYLTELRLEKAAQLLKESFLSVKEIRVKVGITEKSRFTSAFKKKYGVIPLNYRNNNKRMREIAPK